MSRPTILFVCTGNICRSPMAEYLMRDRLGADTAWTVGSAGVAAMTGCPASLPAVQVLRERGIDLTPHRSQPLSEGLVDGAGTIVVMSASHREQIRSRFPRAMDRVFLLKSFDESAPGGDVMDPIGMPVEVYRMICEEIEAALPGLISYLQALE